MAALDLLELDAPLAAVHETLLQNRPITVEQAHVLYEHPDILAVATVAAALVLRKWRGVAHYQSPLRVWLSRWCEGRCRVCDADPPAPNGEIHLVPGPQPAGDLNWHLERIRNLRHQYGDMWIAGLTPPVVESLAEQAQQPLEQILTQLQQAGLDALLGADEEIYTRAGRRFVHAEPMPLEREMAVHAAAHGAGLQTVGGLRYRPSDTAADVVARLDALRNLHRQSAGLTIFAPGPYELEAAPGRAAQPSGYEDLRVLAVGRIFLDNVPHMRVPWLALGLKMGEVALAFGGDDVGWAALDPHVRAFAPSTSFLGLSNDELERILAVAGRSPARVDGSFRHLTPQKEARS